MLAAFLPYVVLAVASVVGGIAAITRLRRRWWAAGVFVLSAGAGMPLLFADIDATTSRLAIGALVAAAFGAWGWRRERGPGALAGALWSTLGLLTPLLVLIAAVSIACPESGCFS